MSAARLPMAIAEMAALPMSARPAVLPVLAIP